MPRPIIPFGEWRPDIATLDNQVASIAENVMPSTNSYVPCQALAATASGSLAQGGNDSFTKVLLHFTGASGGTVITDEAAGGSSHVWSTGGTAVTDTSDFKFGPSSLHCPTAGAFVTTPDHADFTLGTSAFSVKCWVKPALDSSAMWITGQVSSAGTNILTSFRMQRGTSNTVTASVCVSSSQINCVGTSAITSSAGWTQIELRRDIASSRLEFYVNNVLDVGTSIAAATVVNDSTGGLSVGRLGDFTSDTWRGRIDAFQIDVGTSRTPVLQTVPTFLGGDCVGLTFARLAAGTFVTYAGTRTKLFKWTGTAWNDVSRITGGAYNVAAGDQWTFQQSGTSLVAVHIGDVAQVIDVDAGTRFAALGGSPPQATSVYQIGDFLVLSGLQSNKRMIHWSAINNITNWTIGSSLCDVQEFPDGGPVHAVSGGEVGLVVQSRTIRTMQFLPGDTINIFTFSKVEREKGSFAKYGHTFTRGTLYFYAEDGFCSFGQGGLTEIGDHVCNEWFRNNSDPTRINQMQCIFDPDRPHVLWAFYNNSGSTDYDRLLIYDYSQNRWSYSIISAQIWAPLAPTAITLDTDTAEAGDTLLDSTAPSLDSSAYLDGGRSIVAGIDPTGQLAFLDGDNLAATIETAESHLTMGQRSFVNGAYPVVDTANVTVAVSERERLQDTPMWQPAAGVEVTGWVPLLSSSRLHRFRVQTMVGDTWTHAQGVMVDAQPEGEA